MIIDIQALTKSEQLDFEGEEFLSLNEFNNQALKSEYKVKIKGEVVKNGDLYNVSANLHTTLIFRCDRCMKEVSCPIHTNLNSVFSANPIAKREDVRLAQNSAIDITDDIREAVVMELPMKILCKEDCKGMCPSCGANLNNEACSCHQETIDPRLEGLKDIFCQ